MRPVSELYGRHPGSDIYIVGTGSSVRVFPLSFLEGKITIGLNMAWKLAPVTYGVTIHPDLNVPEFMPGEAPRPEIIWITKRRKAKAVLTRTQFAQADRRFYSFEADGQPNTQPPHQPNDAGRILDWVRRPHGDYLYQWSSISQTAANLAANMGAKNVILVGCDNCALLENHHAHDQHTRWKGVDPQDRYRQYHEGLSEVRLALRERGVNLISMTPFLSLLDPETEFQHLCAELDAPTFVANVDASPADQKTSIKIQKQPYANREVNRCRLDAIKAHAGRSILNVGCGSGAYVLELAGEYDIRGIDLQPFPSWTEMPDRFSLSDAAKLNQADDSVDTIVSFETLEHLPDPENVLREYRRVCRKNVILTVPNCDITEGMRKSNMLYSHWSDRTRVQFFNMESITGLVRKAGFRVGHAAYINEINLSPLLLEYLGLRGRTGHLAAGLLRRLGRQRHFTTSLVVGEKA
ncbi:class I SAM-dependent methyltransferase [Rhodospirillaceae bacterium SYSU D60014]|uniref:class I SAM-dependent methyltransferase n=1 Tax=Virgifigura deserti TaxID=2268457 RepID=UPI000E66A336